MNKLYRIKQVSIIILILIIIGSVIISITSKKETVVIDADKNETGQVENPVKSGSFCYYRSEKTTAGFYDTAWIKLNISDNIISGEFQHLPAESDSKVGNFNGEVESTDNTPMNNRANVWWDSRAEGMEVKEELEIIFGDEGATIGFGEMKDRGDGVYVYKDRTNLFYPKQMNKTDCASMEEKLFVEKYIRDNIEKISPQKAVLGGTWYVISTISNPLSNTGEVVYEDGHIQNTASFIYDYDKESNSLTIKSITIK